MTKRFRISASLVALSVFFACLMISPGAIVARGDSSVIPGKYIVILKEGARSTDQVTNAVEGRHRGLHSDMRFGSIVRGFSVSADATTLATLESDPDVAAVIPDRVVTILDAKQSKVSVNAKKSPPPPPPQILPTGVNRINAESLSNKGTNVQVAVVDTGILTTHPDLVGAIAGGYNCTGGSTSNYVDQNGHGTHVSGTIAARSNSIGVVGVAPAAKLWAIKVLNAQGSGSWSSVICGLNYVDARSPAHGGSIKVVNMSLGGGGTSDNNCGNTNNDALHKAICRLRDDGVTVVVAAGNSGADASTAVPSAYNDAVITVSALADSNGVGGGTGSATSYGADDTFASFSNYGSAVDIGAPGVNIYSTYLNNGYATLSGTSMASPHVAGAAALYLATNPSANWSTVRDALVAAGEAIDAGHTDPSGHHSEPVLRVDTF